jgi:hypothetical protein
LLASLQHRLTLKLPWLTQRLPAPAVSALVLACSAFASVTSDFFASAAARFEVSVAFSCVLLCHWQQYLQVLFLLKLT